MKCLNQQSNLENCNCTYSCSKKGICCECIRYHRERRELPACYFPSENEKTYDRSIAYFVRLYQQGKIR
ncbi:MAG: hypothetical protein JW996_02020 [Candidatus Cloacimonetes bacterium]|nr:hypothetical protein [Candidatus Cloacimonadota bacterium]